LFVACPVYSDEARLLGAAAVVNHLLNAVVSADIEIPGIARRITSSLLRIFHRHQPGRADANRHFVHSLIGHGGASVPIAMEGEQKPVIIVDESRLDFILDVVWLAAELGAHVTDLNRLTV